MYVRHICTPAKYSHRKIEEGKSEKENGAGIPSGGWLYEDTVGEWQNDETLKVIGNSI